MTKIKKIYSNLTTENYPNAKVQNEYENSNRQWKRLNIIFIHPNGKKFDIGEGTNFRIEKSEDLFNSLIVAPIDDRIYLEREILISLILDDMKYAKNVTSFFAPNINYTLDILADENRYTTIARINKTLSLSGVESLFGTNEKPASIKINLICDNPVFYEQNAYEITQNSQSEDLFKYPYYLPKQNNEYFMFEIKLPQKLILINNRGNDSNGIEARIKAYSKMINPTFINETTGQVMSIEVILEKGSVMEVNTGTLGAPYIKINGEIKHNLKSLYHKWFKIEKGANMIRFATENKEENCELIITYRNKYRGL